MSLGLKWKKHKSQQGYVLVFYLFLTMLTVSLLSFMAHVAAIEGRSVREQRIADALLLSVLTVRCQSLTQLAQKAQLMEPLIDGVNAAGLQVSHSKWEILQQKANDFKKAIPGYKGHITSTLRVVAEANQRKKEDVQIVDAQAFQLGVQAEPAMVFDENHQSQLMSALWGKQMWATPEPGRLALSADGFIAPIDRESIGHIEWDGNQGQSGYPRAWLEVMQEGQFHPYPAPYFIPVLEAEDEAI